MTLKKGDNVKIMVGKDSGKTGIVEAVFPKIDKVVVAGLNQYKRHVKKSADSPAGGIKVISKPISRANVMIVCPHCKKPVRTGNKITDDDSYRICKNCGKTIEQKVK